MNRFGLLAIGMATWLCTLPLDAMSQFNPRSEADLSSEDFSTAGVPKVEGRDALRRITRFEKDGVTSRLTYDASGRIREIHQPTLKRKFVFDFGTGSEGDDWTAVTLHDDESGAVLGRTHLRNRKLLTPDEQDELSFLLPRVQLIEDPFGGIFWGWQVPPAPPPPQCGRSSCELICDGGAALAGIACGAIGIGTGGTGGMICGAAAVAAWAQCRNRCIQSCNGP
jgi:YD repeat-containing protein